ncbi:MAG: DUF4184 family protein [Herbiconiux sp.]|nr:DUF4184 family protein [Herbiconiux sp.]
MPFTVSHAIVALPFVRSPLAPAAVAAGAMAPDLPLFLPVGADYGTTHELPGVLLAAIPLAFATLLLWRVVVRPAVPFVVPAALAARLPAEWSRGARDGWRSLWRSSPAGTASAGAVLALLAALTIGVVSHVVWDAFTHAGRWGTHLVPALDSTIAGLPGSSWLQYLSSTLGFAGLAAALVVWIVRRTSSRVPEWSPARAPKGSRAPTTAWRRWAPTAFWLVVAGAAVAGVLRAIASVPAPLTSANARDLVFALLTDVGAATAVALVLACLGLQLVRRVAQSN